MKIRLKFSKEGRIKFIGHLDLLRLFQKIIKSIKLPIAYSKGYNPHPLLYFAQALSLGITSEGEYLDIHLEEVVNPQIVKEEMNNILPEGIRIIEACKLSESSKKPMALVDASRYLIYINKNKDHNDILNLIKVFYSQEEILYERISKKRKRLINIKDFIYEFKAYEEETRYVIDVMLAAGSRKNLNASLFIESFIKSCQLELSYSIHRKELFYLQDKEFIPLWKLGE